MDQTPEHMKACPLCGMKIVYDQYKANSFASYSKGLDVHTIALYAHINDSNVCVCKDAICPHCQIDFDDGEAMPWRRLAIHWRRFGHLTEAEHCIVCALSGDV